MSCPSPRSCARARAEPPRRRRRHLHGAAVALALATAGLPAAAQTSPYYIGVSQTLLWDDNIVRLRDSQPTPAGISKSDLVSSTALVAGIDQPIGRQRLSGSAALRSTRFADNDQYNSNGYSLNLGLDWATVGRVSGRLGLSGSRTPRASVRDRSEQVITERNVEQLQGFNASVSVGLVTQWSAQVDIRQSDLRYSAAAADFREYRQRAGSAGLVWRPSGLTRLSVGLGQERTEYPNLLPPPGDPRDVRTRNSLDLGASWEPTGVSRFDARLSSGKTRHERFSVRDFSSTSGSLGWNWRPSGKLQIDTRLSRDEGQDGEVLTTAFSRTTDRLQVQGLYALSAKVTLNAGATVYRRELDGSGTFFGGLAGRDNGRLFGVGARWAPLRNVSVGCNVDTERRGRNSNAVLSDPYRANSVGCFGQIVLQ